MFGVNTEIDGQQWIWHEDWADFLLNLMWLNHCSLKPLLDFLCLSKAYSWHHPHNQALFYSSSLFFLLLKIFNINQPYSGLAFMPLHKTVHESSQLRCSALLYCPEIQLLSEFSYVHLIDYLLTQMSFLLLKPFVIAGHPCHHSLWVFQSSCILEQPEGTVWVSMM